MLGRRRVAAVAVAVGGLLIGGGVLANALERQPTGFPAPPTPPELVVSSPTPQPRLGVAPTEPATTGAPPPATAPPTAASPAGGSAPAGGSESPTGPTGPTAPPDGHRAVDGEHGSHAQVVPLPGTTDFEVVRLGGQAAGAFVRFTGVSAEAAGELQLTIFYASEHSRTGTVAVNDGPGQPVSFPATGDEGQLGSVAVPVELGAGGNSIQVSSGGGPPFYLDRVAVTSG